MLWPGTWFLEETAKGPSYGEAMMIAAGIGASVGMAFDLGSCHPRGTEDSETVALLERIRGGERMQRISVLTKGNARLELLDPFIRDEALHGLDRRTEEEVVFPVDGIRRLSVPANRTKYIIVGLVGVVVGLFTWDAYAGSE